jgi:hypothetical protein
MEEVKERLPAAVAKRQRIVHMGDGEGVVVVTKWSGVKLLAILKDLFGSATQFPPEFAEAVQKGDFSGGALWLWENLQNKVIGIIELSVRPEDAGKIKELDAEDFLAVLDAILELNLTDGFLGKAKALVARARKALPKKTEKESSKPSSPATR